jgi:hypothetical protein
LVVVRRLLGAFSACGVHPRQLSTTELSTKLTVQQIRGRAFANRLNPNLFQNQVRTLLEV